MSESQIFELIAGQLSLAPKQINTVAALLDEGATIPFLARYRKEVTGGLDEDQLRKIRDAVEFRRSLEARRLAILKSIEEQGKLTDELRAAIMKAEEMKLLEDLYLPYKPKRLTRGMKAIAKGLEPLAKMMWDQQETSGTPEEHAKAFINAEMEVNTVEEALQGARDIVAEWINEQVQVREALRTVFRKSGVIVAKKLSTVTERTVFESYYEFNQRVKFIKPYQTLALNRGEREKVLSVSLEVDEERALDAIDEVVLHNEEYVFIDEFLNAIEDGYKRLLFPSLERELRNELTDAADEHAILTFAKNLGNLLMQPPLKSKVVMGMDPAFRTGCKVAVVDQFGKYLEGTTIYPVEPHNRVAEAEAAIHKLIETHKVQLIAIGNGTASRETEQFVADYLRRRKAHVKDDTLSYMIVNEAGASVYSASDVARQEFPELDAAQRGNISIARRVQDPLAELVKIDPKSIGVGLYQHDVNQVRLMQSLGDVVESAVNTVGVNLNTASSALLTYVSGLTQRVAESIVKKRETEGAFARRDQLLDVPGMGPFRFEQAAGFLRIPESPNPLDNTAIHPESYAATTKLCQLVGIEVKELTKHLDTLPLKLKKLNLKDTAASLGIGIPTLELIIENLSKPGRDPRENLPKPLLRQDILKIEDLTVGQEMEGTVRNVVDFGAFVDLGVKQDALLHISKMSKQNERKIENPHEVVSVGDIIKVVVDSLDIERGRISVALV